AEEAYAMGLVSEVVDDDQVMTRATELAGQIAKLPPIAVAQIKELILLGPDAPLQTALAMERKAVQLLFATSDKQEGMQAFLDKRKPNFIGS
ncbi:MAG: enoyl-CoA hydratase-related protein, partial [Nitratireductor sp.]